jgi:gamma-glutamyltranspeptidase/glutathione hydrolase
MTPTIVLKGGKPFLVTGSPGGSRIISTVLQIITNVIDFHMPIAEAVSAPRLHHQWQPDEVFVEPGFDPAVLAALAARGHKIVPTRPGTSANSIEVVTEGRPGFMTEGRPGFMTEGHIVGAADPRTRGALAAGY